MSVNFFSAIKPHSSELVALSQHGYIVGSKIGRGSYATVHLADFNDPTCDRRQRLACKIFDKDKANQELLDNYFPRELEILTKLENPYIIQIHSIFQRGPRVFVFMRYAENGDLLGYLEKNNIVKELTAREWFRQMAVGLRYLHSKQISHRDLKCENILLSKEYVVKLADFGFARYCVDHDGHRVWSQTYCGTLAYTAPEVISETPYNPKLADVWSLGIILYIMLNGVFPFDDSNPMRILRDQFARKWSFCPEVQELVSTEAKSMVTRILEPDLTQRISLDQILKHGWLNRLKMERRSNLSIPFWLL